MSIYHDGSYEKSNPDWHIEDSVWKAEQIYKIITKNELDIKTICDVGCGAGEILNQLYLKMPNHTIFDGIEISPQAYELCKKRRKDRINFYLKDIAEEKKYYDLVLVIDVIEHVEDYISFLRILRNKGKYKLFNIPLDLYLSIVPSKMIYTKKKYGHLHFFNKELALDILRDTGYQIVDYTLTPAYNIPSANKLYLIPRKIMYSLSRDLCSRLLGGTSLLVLTK